MQDIKQQLLSHNDKYLQYITSFHNINTPLPVVIWHMGV